MDLQTIIVGFIILLAAIYVGKNVVRKVRGFSPKSMSCGSDCGCGVKDKKLV